MLMGRDLYTVSLADITLTEQCMRKQGFIVTLNPPFMAKEGNDLTYRRYGAPDNLADARAWGYTLPPDAGGGAPPPRLRLTQAEETALGGTMAEELHYAQQGGPPKRFGCYGVADQELSGGSTSLAVAGLENSEIVRAVNLDPRATDSPTEEADVKKFSQCMASAGYPDVNGPFDIPHQFDVANANNQPVTRAQISAAITQYDCSQSSGLRAAMQAAETAFQLKAIDANPLAFAQIKSDLAAVVRRATTIVGSGG